MRGLTPGKNKFIEEREGWTERTPLVEVGQPREALALKWWGKGVFQDRAFTYSSRQVWTDSVDWQLRVAWWHAVLHMAFT